MEIYIIRHGETIWNKQKLLQGRTDIELTEAGKQLARITGEQLMGVAFDRIYSSPLKRAYETAVQISNGRNIPILKNDLLKEISFGDWEGQNMSVLSKDGTQKFRYFFDKPQLYESAANGENLDELCKRAATFMENVIEPAASECNRIMIVAHGAINKALMRYIKKQDMEYFWSGGLQKNCGAIIIDYTNGNYTILDESRIFYESSAL